MPAHPPAYRPYVGAPATARYAEAVNRLSASR
jgi:hypothetical protein